MHIWRELFQLLSGLLKQSGHGAIDATYFDRQQAPNRIPSPPIPRRTIIGNRRWVTKRSPNGPVASPTWLPPPENATIAPSKSKTRRIPRVSDPLAHQPEASNREGTGRHGRAVTADCTGRAPVQRARAPQARLVGQACRVGQRPEAVRSGRHQ